MSVNNLNALLKEKGIKPSYQRIKIYEYLEGTTMHPTVDRIYKDLMDDIPTLSKTTVYNTMQLFIEKGLAMVITIDENETRYDCDTSLHGHFKCIKCDEVKDFKVSLDQIDSNLLEGNEVLGKQVFYYGICKACKNDGCLN